MFTMEELIKITIVIPSYNRHKFLYRQIDYWKDYNATVIILDGSKSPLHLGQKERIPSNIQYHHLPISIEERLKFSSSLINTSFAVLLSDDEFFIPSALKNCIKEMEKDNSISVCKGLSVGFDHRFNKLKGYQVYEKLKSYKIDHKNPATRVNDHLGNYTMAVLWGLTRTEVFKKMLAAIGKGPFSTAAAVEMQCSIIGAWEGKIEIVNELMWLRSFENDNIWWSFGNLQFESWLKSEKHTSEVNSFISSIVNEINHFNVTEEDVKHSIRKALNSFAEISKVRSSLSMMINSLDKKVRFQLKKIIFFLFKKEFGLPFEIVIDKLENEGFLVDRKEVKKIIKIIQEFH